jgi:uncharacterized membrane protein
MPVARRLYIDWLRGLAAVIMIEAHTVDSWTARSARGSWIFPQLQFLAGWAAPLFLFLAGVSVALAGAAKLKATGDLDETGWALQKRGWQIFGLAFLFRLQSFLLSPGVSWLGMLKPDILNVMGLAIVASAYGWSRGVTARSRAIWLLGPVALIMIIAPLSRAWTWPARLEPHLEAYLRPNGHGTFSLFPWAAFVLVGTWLGQWIVAARPPTEERRFHVRLGAGGLGLAIAAFIGSFFPAPLTHSSFWTTSLSWFLLRAGVMIVGLALAWLWMQRPGASRWSPMIVFGKTSFFVYWIHVEIVYGFMTYPLRGELSIPGVLVAYVVFTLIMLACASAWSRRVRGPLIPAFLTILPSSSASRDRAIA